MSRPLRLHAPGLFHHVFVRGNNKADIFEDNADCAAFLQLLSVAAARFRVACAAYCLLRNHYHLLLVPSGETISRVMQQVNSTYCQRFNRRHGRVGHVLQGRFGCRIVEDGAYARAVLRYIALNPVAAGVAAAPEDWPWSSYRVALGGGARPRLLSLHHVWRAFGASDARVGRARFALFVQAGLQERAEALLDGGERLRQRLGPALERQQTNDEFVYAHRYAARPPLGMLLEGVSGRERLEDAARTAFYRHGYGLAELGRVLHRHPATICRWIHRAAARARAQAGVTRRGQLCKEQDLTPDCVRDARGDPLGRAPSNARARGNAASPIEDIRARNKI